jgi:hypothetical protein
MIVFSLKLGLFISILILDIDNCHEVITCHFNSALGHIILRQRNIFSQGVIELPLSDIETVKIS